MTTCMVFVFAALLEYAVVQWVSRLEGTGPFYKKKVDKMQRKKMGQYISQFDKIRSCFHSSPFSCIPYVDNIISK
jgi:hypothetical protein